MKTINFFPTAILAFSLCISIISCGDDNEPFDGGDNGGGTTDPTTPDPGKEETTYKLEAIDLNLPSGTLWANMNIGAKTPFDYGDYFAWGEIAPKDSYSLENYCHYDKAWNSYTKYITSYITDKYLVDNITRLESTDDAATRILGEEWCLPTQEQWNELIQYVSHPIIREDTLNHRKIIAFDKYVKDKVLYFPIAGYMTGKDTTMAQKSVEYWTADLYKNSHKSGIAFSYFTPTYDLIIGSCERHYGLPIRAVLKKKKGEL